MSKIIKYLEFKKAVKLIDKNQNEHNFFPKNLYKIKGEKENCYIIGGTRNKKKNNSYSNNVLISTNASSYSVIIREKKKGRRYNKGREERCYYFD